MHEPHRIGLACRPGSSRKIVERHEAAPLPERLAERRLGVDPRLRVPLLGVAALVLWSGKHINISGYLFAVSGSNYTLTVTFVFFTASPS